MSYKLCGKVQHIYDVLSIYSLPLGFLNFDAERRHPEASRRRGKVNRE